MHVRVALALIGRGAHEPQNTLPHFRQWWRRRRKVNGKPQLAAMQTGAALSGTHGAASSKRSECASVMTRSEVPASTFVCSSSCKSVSCSMQLPDVLSWPLLNSAIAADWPPPASLRAASREAREMVAAASESFGVVALTTRRRSGGDPAAHISAGELQVDCGCDGNGCELRVERREAPSLHCGRTGGPAVESSDAEVARAAGEQAAAKTSGGRYVGQGTSGRVGWLRERLASL